MIAPLAPTARQSEPDLSDIAAEIAQSYGAFFSRLNGYPAYKHAADVLNPVKIHEKVALLQQFVGDIRGASLLEVGCGFGLFVAVTRTRYGAHSFGIEPDGPGFGDSIRVARRVVRRYGVTPRVLAAAIGERIPMRSNSFDIVYSTNVLEHVQHPAAVLGEVVRVLRPGGIAQMVVPNYGSFWEGHYGMFWPPYTPHWLGRLLVRAAGRDPAFVDTLQLVTLRGLRQTMRKLEPQVQVLDWGEALFHERLTRANFSAWAALGRVKAMVNLLKRFGVAHVASTVLRATDAITPIVLTFRKQETRERGTRL